MPTNALIAQLDSDGFAILPHLLNADEISEARACCEAFCSGVSSAGIRFVLEKSPPLARMIEQSAAMETARTILGHAARIVRSIFFDKNRHANWDVAWHQDTTIAVRNRKDTSGFGPWSIKDGVPHVRPPAEILENMLAVRIHLDDCGAENGALHVIPGSHRSGVLSSDEIAGIVMLRPEICEVQTGGAMLMRPLLVHSSKKSLYPTRRRVIHLEFAAHDLPHGLVWAA